MNRNGIVHLDCWSIKIFSLLGVLSALIFILWGFCPMLLLAILAFLCPPTWPHDENVDCPHLYHVITWTEMGSYTLIVGVLKYFLFGGFACFDFYHLGLLSYGAFVHFSFCLSTHAISWRECWFPHLYHVITWTEMGSYTLIVGVLKYFLFWSFCPLWFLSFGALSYVVFFHCGFSLSAHMIAWRERWFSTPVSCAKPQTGGM